MASIAREGLDFDKIYPIGSIYISANSTNPHDLFGGTWEQLSGRFLIGAGTVDSNTTDFWGTIKSNFNMPPGEKGGEDYHTLTIEQMPSHSHSGYVEYGTNSNLNVAVPGQYNQINFTYHVDGYHRTFIENTGEGNYHNNMPPYLAVYMWKRIG